MDTVFVALLKEEKEVLEKAAKEMNTTVEQLIRDSIRDHLLPKLEGAF